MHIPILALVVALANTVDQPQAEIVGTRTGKVYCVAFRPDGNDSL